MFAAHGLEILESRLLMDSSNNSPTLTDFVLYTDGSLQFGRGVTVASGWSGAGDKLSADRSTSTRGLAAGDELAVQSRVRVVGDVIANDEVSVGEGATVDGGVDASGTVFVHDGAHVTGTVHSSAQIIRMENNVELGGAREFGNPRVFQAPGMPEPSEFATDPNRDIDVGPHRSFTIEPGAYGTLHLQKPSTLHLSTGSYYFEEISAERKVVLNFNLEDGPIAVFVSGAVDFHRRLDVELHGGDARDVFLETHDDFHLHRGGQWFGTVFAPEGEIRLGRRTTFVGAAYSGEGLLVNHRSRLDHAPAHRLFEPPGPRPVGPLPCEPLTHLTEFTVATADAPAAGVAIDRYTRGSANFVGDLQPLVPAGGDRIGVAIAALDADLRTDVVSVSVTSNEVLVFLDTPDGILGEPARYASGGTQPTTVSVGNFTDGPALDIAVGHEDGTLAFLDGVGDGSFRSRPDLTVRGLGPIASLAHADFDHDGDEDLVVVASGLTLFVNVDDVLTAPAIRNGSFAEALAGWTTDALGDRGGVPGRVIAAGGMAQLVENDSFLVSLNQTFTVPPTPQSLSFDLMSLILEDPQGGVPDAIEVSLLDADGNSLVSPFRAGATSFFNVNPSVAPSLAPGVTFDGTRVTLDISALVPGTSATLYFDLIGNGPGSGSSAVIDNVRIAPEAIYVDASLPASLLSVVSGRSAVSHCDADGDGDLDLLVHEPAVPRLTVLANEGSGTFEQVVAGGSPRTAIAGSTGSRQSIEIGQVVSDSIGTVGEEDQFTFEAGLQTLLFDAQQGSAATFDWTLTGPFGDTPFDGSFADFGPVLQEVPGTLTLTVRGHAGGTGPYQFQIHAVQFISIGDVATDSLASPGDERNWVFNVPAGQPLFIDFQALSGGPLVIELFAPDGTRLLSDSGTAAGELDNGPITLADAGQYQLNVTGDGTNTPDYQFQLLEQPPVPPDVRTINIGEVASGAIESLGAVDIWEFTAAAGQSVFVDFQALTLSSGSLNFRLQAPGGSVLLSNNGISTAGLDTGPVTLADAGVYSLVVEGVGDTPTYQFQLWDVPPPDAAPLTLGNATDGAIESPGATDVWTFSAVAGQSLFIDFTALTDRANIRLDAPDGMTVLRDGGSLLDNGPITLPDTGVYRFTVAGSGDRTPSYQFTMWDVRPDVPMPISVGTPISPAPVSDVRRPGESLTFTFDAAAGDELALRVSLNANDANVFTLVSPAGDEVVLASVTDVLLGPFTVTGTYSLHVTLPPFQPPDLHGAFTFEVVKLVAPRIGEADSRGTEFWLAIPQNIRDPFQPQPVEVSVMLAAVNDTTAIVTIPAIDYIRFVDIPAGGLVTVVLPSQAELGGQLELTEDKGIRIIASDEVSVFGHSNQRLTSDGFLGLPTDVLGTEYLVLGYEATVFTLPGTQLAVLATEDNTTVTITPAESIGSHEAGASYDVQLGRGQAYQLASVLDVGADVTGTVITSDKPIAVFGGNRCTVVPVGPFDACDYLVEQLPPVGAWGLRFVTLPLASRFGGDTFRMLAQQDGTEVRVNGAVIATLNRGQFHEQLIDGPAEITASLPILVAQYANSESFDGTPADPFMMLVPPAEQFGNDYTLPALDDPDYDRHFVNITAPAVVVGLVTLDGVAVAAGDYVAIGSSGFFGAQVPVSVGTHRLTGPLPFGASIYGFGNFDSYAFTGGVNLTPPVMVASVYLEPALTSRVIGSQLTVTASVADQFDQPLAGIQVGFTVTGVNATTGSAVTDSAGEARFTFTGANPGVDSIVAFVGTLFDTASVRWATSGPLLTIVSPADGTEFDKGSVQLVTGQALPGDPSGAVVGVTINGLPVASLDGAGNFFALVTVAAGTYDFEVAGIDSNGVTASEPLRLTGVAPPTETAVDNLESASNLGRFTYERTTFNRRTRTLHADLRLTNIGAESLAGAALAVFSPFGPPSVALIGDVANLPSPDNRAYVSLDMSIPTAGLAAGATSDALPLEFSNPRAVRFDVAATLVVTGNEAPRFTSAPGFLTVANTPYDYDADAADANRNVLRYSLETAPAGMTIDAQTGAINWLPVASELGLHNITVVVADGYGGAARQSYALRVVEPPPDNRDPIIVSSPVTTANLSSGPYGYSAIALDPDPQPLTYSLATAPAGMMIDPATGVVTWPVTASDVGQHNVELRVEDGQGGSDSQAFVVEIIHVVPGEIRGVTFEDSNGDGVQGAAEPGLPGFTIYLDANDNGRRDTGEFFAVTGPDGSYSIMGILPGTQRVAQQPQTGWDQTFPSAGTHSVVISAGGLVGGIHFGNRTNGSTNNSDPKFTTEPVTTAKVNNLYRYDATAADPDGDDLTFALVSGPAGMSVDAASGSVVWRPAPDQQVTQTVLIQVADGQGGIAVQSFFLFVYAEFQPPVFTSAPTLIGTAGEVYRYHAMAFDPAADPISFGLSVRPIGMSIDPQTGELTWSPAATDFGNHRVEVRATNASGLTAFQSFDLEIRPANTAPRFTTDPMLDSAAGEFYEYDADAVDADDAITFSLVTAPAGMTINSLTGLVTWRAGVSDLGAHDVIIRVTDDRGLSTDQSYTLTIGPDTEPPVVDIVPSRSVINPGETILIQVTATDNVAVVSRTLEIGGVVVPLGAGGAPFTATVPGLVDVVGSATDAAGNVATTMLRLRVADPADTVPPEIVIASPLPGSVVSYLTDVIGSITGADLEFFRVDFARLDQVVLSDIAADVPGWATYPTPPENWAMSPWTFVAYGTTEVSNDRLGVFDPTVLDNDNYVIRVVAQDFSGNINVQALTVGVEGQAKLGQFSLEFVDLSVPLAGIPIQVTRRYSTLETADQGAFGFGWSLSVAEADIRETLPPSLEPQFGPLFATPFRADTRVYLTDPNGRRIGFTFTPRPEVSLIGTYFIPEFTPDPGVYDKLEVDPTSLSQAADGSFNVFLIGLPYNPSAYRLVRPDGTVYHYNQFTGLEGVTDRNGNGLTYTDTGIFHSSGESIQFVRDALGRISEIIDPAGNAIRYEYDAAGDLIAVTDQVGQTTQFTYFAEPAHYLNEAIDSLGRVAQRTEYDDQGRIVAVTDALGNRQEQLFDPANFTGSRIDAKGNLTTYLYNERGNILELHDPLGGIRTFAYDDPLNPDRETAITDENGHTTTFSYDDRGNLLTWTDALGGVTRWTYDTFSNVTSFTDALGRTTNATYDSRGNLTELVSPAGDRLQFTYDAEGRVIQHVGARGGITTLVYGTGPRPTRVTNPNGTSREYTYTDLGPLQSVTDETGFVTTFFYDDSGRLMGRRDPLGNEVTFAYAGNNIVNTTDALGHTTSFEYDAVGNVIRQVDQLGNVTTSSYDANGNLTSLTDPIGNTTAFTYDALDRVIATTDPLGQTTTFRYDALGNQTEVVDRNGRRRVFDYDAINRPIRESWFDAGTQVRTIDSTYDAVDNLLVRSDSDSTYQFTYDVLDRVLSVDNAGTPGVPAVVLSYAYDGDGNQLRVQDSLGVSVDSTYDPNGQLTVRTWQGSGIDPARVDFSYNASGERTGVDRFRDLAGTQLVGRTAIARDSLQRITGIQHRDALDAVLADYDYMRDPLGQVMQETRNGQAVDYSYDLLGQLVETQRAGLVDEVFAYDANGNRTGGDNVVGPNNRLLSDGVFSYEYDAEGNLIQKTETTTSTVTTYTYDNRNRLVRVEEQSVGGIILNETSFTYDVFDRRIAKTSNGQTTYTIYDGYHAWADLDASGAVRARYLFGRQIDEILARFRPGEGTAWYLTDRLDTIRNVTDSAGSVIGSLDYTSFGVVIAESGAVDRFRFTGREFIGETGLYDYRHRYYDPRVGRFLSADPFGFVAGDLNLYRYVGNAPTNASDPLGLADAPEEGIVSIPEQLAKEAAEEAFCNAATEIIAAVPLSEPAKLAAEIGVEISCAALSGAPGPRGKPTPPLFPPPPPLTPAERRLNDLLELPPRAPDDEFPWPPIEELLKRKVPETPEYREYIEWLERRSTGKG